MNVKNLALRDIASQGDECLLYLDEAVRRVSQDIQFEKLVKSRYHGNENLYRG